MIYRIRHRTTYAYSAPVTVSHHVARLRPRTTATQRVLSFGLEVSPAAAVTTTRTDYFGNTATFFSVEGLHSELVVSAEGSVEVNAMPLPAIELSPSWEDVAAMFRDPVSPGVVDACQFVFDSPLLAGHPDFAAYARASFPDGTPLLAGVRNLTARLHHDFTFDPRATTVSTPLHTVFARRRGVCQDFAHLGIACLRSLGLPARYVSGYLRTDPPAGQPRLVGADHSHAWLSVYCPHLGFVDFDPTNNLIPSDRHVTLAYGRDFSEVSPLAGMVTGGGEHRLAVAVDVSPAD
jgi:transglutaminase-like putative cysteine protease